jgi:NAD(P)-dependent dehydrogenase (short-subunit alcohol dehydrogenase family)
MCSSTVRGAGRSGWWRGRFAWPAPLWEQLRRHWDAMTTAGVRAALVAGQLAARRMVPARRGLVVNLSFWATQKYIGNVLYGVAKAATDKLKADMGTSCGGTALARSLFQGLVRTEAVLAAGVFDEQLGEPTVHRARSGRLGRGPGSAALEWAGGRCGRVGPGVRVHTSTVASLAKRVLIHRCRPSGAGARPHNSCRSSTHQWAMLEHGCDDPESGIYAG